MRPARRRTSAIALPNRSRTHTDMELIDLSHVIEDGMVTYPGLPGPEISEHLSFDESRARYAANTEFTIGRISLVANTGTYLDTAAHRCRGGADLGRLPLEQCALLPSVVVDGGAVIGLDDFEGVDLDLEGCAVLLRTGWDRHWGTDAYGDAAHPFLSEAGAQRLVATGAALVGIDSVNIDDTSAGEMEAAALFAVARYREATFGHLLMAGDSLVAAEVAISL